MTRYVPVPHALTTPLALPAPPPRHCQWHGQPAVCVQDAWPWVQELIGKLRQANIDRATTATLGAGEQGD